MNRSVSLHDIVKNFGKVRVINGVSCDIADGEFIVILGPSGCGKSTLLRIIAGLETATSGEVEIGGRMVNRLEPKDRNIAFVFQNYALYPHMTVWHNMAYGLKVRGMPRPEIEERVKNAATILGLEGFMERKPRELSGGQRQRVAMGRAIVREPQVFLFDEPLSNLDAKLRVQMRMEIKKLHQTVGTTSIFVTHDQVEAMTLADRLIVMNAGNFEQVGTPMSVYERPETTFVAEFLGSPAMNLISAKLSADGRSVEVGPESSWPLDTARPHLAGLPVTLGVRPENLELRQGGSRLVADMVEPLGADTLVHGRLVSGGAVVTVRLPGSIMVREGDTLELGVPPERLHLFDHQTGKRLP
ncbi:MAG TPA: sn-glycerol-3-phosphate import ATP-binding protein UgpC [Deinococcales bacterium]|nr:sn-glycerol-3-phosphate import ATP-binding protein UgpC [Deinococcales bacterium]